LTPPLKGKPRGTGSRDAKTTKIPWRDARGFLLCRTLPTMPTIVSGFFKTDVMNFVECPECMQPAGTCCITYKGKKQSEPHKSRVEAYTAKFSDRIVLYTDAPDRLKKILRYNQRMIRKASASRS
jgi:hypothetical protein